MTAASARINLLDLDESGLRTFFSSLGEKPFRAQQVLKWIYHHQVSEFSAMTDLGLDLRQRLAAVAEIRTPEVLHEQTSADGTTIEVRVPGRGPESAADDAPAHPSASRRPA